MATHVLSWWQAIEAARKLARGSDDDGRPVSVKEAVDAFARDLASPQRFGRQCRPDPTST